MTKIKCFGTDDVMFLNHTCLGILNNQLILDRTKRIKNNKIIFNSTEYTCFEISNKELREIGIFDYFSVIRRIDLVKKYIKINKTISTMYIKVVIKHREFLNKEFPVCEEEKKVVFFFKL